MKQEMNKLFATIGVAAQVGLSVAQLHAQEKKMNVLFIAGLDLITDFRLPIDTSTEKGTGAK